MKKYDISYSEIFKDISSENLAVEVLRDHWRKVVGYSLAATLIAFASVSLFPKNYKTDVKFLAPQQQQSIAASAMQSLGAIGGLAGAAAGIRNPIDQYVSLIKTRAVTDDVLNRVGLMPTENERHIARRQLEKRVKISAGKDNIVVIEIEAKSGAEAAKTAEAYIAAVDSIVSNLNITDAQQRSSFFGKQLQAARTQLDRASRELGTSGITKETLRNIPANTVEVLSKISAQIRTAEIELSRLRQSLSENSYQIKAVNSELLVLRKQLSDIQSGIDDPKSADAKNESYTEKYRQYKFNEALVEMLARQYELAKVDEGRDGAGIQVVDRPEASIQHSSPRRTLICSAVFVFTLFVTSFLLIFRRWYPSFKSAKR